MIKLAADDLGREEQGGPVVGFTSASPDDLLCGHRGLARGQMPRKTLVVCGAGRRGGAAAEMLAARVRRRDAANREAASEVRRLREGGARADLNVAGRGCPRDHRRKPTAVNLSWGAKP
ncbi:MAG: hypothetical protein ACLUE1_06750 [Adlercreutzia equolifaciens]